MSLNHKKYYSYLHNKMSGETLYVAMLSTTALLHGIVRSDLHLVLLGVVMQEHSCPDHDGFCQSRNKVK